MLARLLFPLLLVASVFYVGHGFGRAGKKRAVSTAYREFIPVLASCRQLLLSDPMQPATYAVAQEDLRIKLDHFESEVRAL